MRVWLFVWERLRPVRVVQRWPDILVVQLLRTGWNRHTHDHSKVMTAVNSFVDINLCGVTYACQAVVIHTGEAIQSGHYISYLFPGSTVVRINNDHLVLVPQEQINQKLLYLFC